MLRLPGLNRQHIRLERIPASLAVQVTPKTWNQIFCPQFLNRRRLRCQKISLICPQLILLIGSRKVPLQQLFGYTSVYNFTFSWVDGNPSPVKTFFIFPILIPHHSATSPDGQQSKNGHSSQTIFCCLFGQDMSEEQAESNGRNV